MNKFIICLTPGSTPTHTLAQEIIRTALGSKIDVFYSHFYQPDGMADDPTPLSISWWRSPEANPSILMLINWRAPTSMSATMRMSLAQRIADDPDCAAMVYLNLQGRSDYTEAAHQEVVQVARFLSTLRVHDALITHVYSTSMCGQYGTMIGLDLTPDIHRWIVDSLSLSERLHDSFS